MYLARECAVALEAVASACRLAAGVQQSLVRPESLEKDDRSPVTVADLGSQVVMTLDILRAFPRDMIMGEENTDILRGKRKLKQQLVRCIHDFVRDEAASDVVVALDSAASTGGKGRFWVMDPIDGTKGFLRGEHYAVALALVESGNVILGVLGCPEYTLRHGEAGAVSGILVYAVAGKGAYVRACSGGEDLPIESIARSGEIRLCESVEPGHANHELHARVASRLGISAPPLRIDSQSKYAAVALGDASIYLRMPRDRQYREKIWDHAAGTLILQECGGQVTDFSGKLLDFSAGRTLEHNTGIVATSGGIHQRVLEAIRECCPVA